MELLERFLGSDGDSDGESGADGDDDMLFEDDGGLDDFGGDDGFDDDLGFDDGDDGGAATAELEGRIDELENEVASLSSTVSTIRSENEEISNTVEDVEENVRKLLDIYEMVTRGVNPFVDDAQAGSGFDGGGGGGSLGLFDDTSDDEEDEDLDEDIAGADAEEFFDDDFLDGETDDDDGFDDFEEPTESGSPNGNTMGDDADDSGKSFEELKNEYESGDAEWAEEDDGDVTNGDSDAAFEDGNAGEFEDDFAAGDDDLGFDDGDDGGAADEFGTPAEAGDGFDAEATAEVDPDPPESAPDAAEAPQNSPGDLQFAANTLMDSDASAGAGKPYLDRLPAGYVGDLLVMEWLEYLVDHGDVSEAARAVEYYRRIQWLGEDAADELHEFLRGFGDVDDVSGAPAGLSIDHHVASLRYISRLTGSTADSIVFESWSGGGGVPFGL